MLGSTDSDTSQTRWTRKNGNLEARSSISPQAQLKVTLTDATIALDCFEICADWVPKLSNYFHISSLADTEQLAVNVTFSRFPLFIFCSTCFYFIWRKISWLLFSLIGKSHNYKLHFPCVLAWQSTGGLYLISIKALRQTFAMMKIYLPKAWLNSLELNRKQ